MDMHGLLYGLLSLQVETLLYPIAKVPKKCTIRDGTEKNTDDSW
jgi:hypothetical protein